MILHSSAIAGWSVEEERPQTFCSPLWFRAEGHPPDMAESSGGKANTLGTPESSEEVLGKFSRPGVLFSSIVIHSP